MRVRGQGKRRFRERAGGLTAFKKVSLILGLVAGIAAVLALLAPGTSGSQRVVAKPQILPPPTILPSILPPPTIISPPPTILPPSTIILPPTFLPPPPPPTILPPSTIILPPSTIILPPSFLPPPPTTSPPPPPPTTSPPPPPPPPPSPPPPSPPTTSPPPPPPPSPPPPVTPAGKCVVPQVRGMAVADAKVELTDANCKPGRTYRRYNKVVPKGEVIRTVPKPGSIRANGWKVALFVSRGNPPKKK